MEDKNLKRLAENIESYAQENELLLLRFRLAVLNEIAEEYEGKTIENVIQQIQSVIKEREHALSH